MAQFCQQHVEPMGKECEQIQVLALAEAFGVTPTVFLNVLNTGKYEKKHIEY